MNFGYKDDCFYFHTGAKGQKIDYLKANNKVCVQLDVGCEVERAPLACKFYMKYKSVIVFGEADFIEEVGEKKKALHIIMAHYSDETYDFPDELVEKVAVIKMSVDSMTGKKRQ